MTSGPELLETMFSPSDRRKHKARTAAADRPLDTAVFVAVIALIGLAVFFLWDRHHSLRQARHMLELRHQSQGNEAIGHWPYRGFFFEEKAAGANRISAQGSVGF
jgi:hypothetical protein